MGRLAQIIMNQKPLSASELVKAKANQAIQQVKRKEQAVKKATGVDGIENEANQAAKGVADHSSNIASASPLESVHSISPSLLAKVGRNEKLSPVEQKQLATFFKAVGWL